MPYIQVQIAQTKSVPTAKIAHALTDLAVSTLGKNAQAAVVAIQLTPHWFVAGEPQSGFAVTINITQGTNSAEQKAAFIQQADACMHQFLPDAANTSYTSVIEIPADSWGYGGLTQGARKH